MEADHLEKKEILAREELEKERVSWISWMSRCLAVNDDFLQIFDSLL